MSDRIFIGVAWPYANGDLHLGHVAGSLLPPDIFRRYHELQDNDVLMASGSDMHGTPITVSAEEEGVPPGELAARYNERHKETLARLDIDFDIFTSTATENHREVVHDLFLTLLDEGYIDRRTKENPFDPVEERFLPDRYVEGTCPHCGYDGARGDQCDECGRTLDPDELEDPESVLSGETPAYRETEHFFLRLGDFQSFLESWVADQKEAAGWRSNAVNFTEDWLDEGLHDRAITRDMTYGVPIPDEAAPGEDLSDKRIYVWFEAVTGYLSAPQEWAQDRGEPDRWRDFWQDAAARHYYFLGKDNIPFHTIIWPAMIRGYREGEGEHYELPHDVPANEFLNLGDEQFSKSRGVAIWADDVVDRFGADPVRYYLSINMPEERDAAWTWDDFLSKVNDELVGALGNFCHRVLTLVDGNFEAVPEGPPDDDRTRESEVVLEEVHGEVTAHLEACEFKKALREAMRLAREGNRYLADQEPWADLDSDPDRAGAVLHHAYRLARAVTILTAPYVPGGAEDLWDQLGYEGSVLEASWDDALAPVEAGRAVGEPEPVFDKLDPDEVPTEGDGEPDADEEHDEPTEEHDVIPFERFEELDIRIAKVTDVDDHPDADKLYVVTVDVGDEERQLVAGLKPYMLPQDLEGKRVAVVANLEPATIRGVESQGMLLAAEAGDEVTLLTPEKGVPPGSQVK
jgi:methionyl-tRNA synthetase